MCCVRRYECAWIKARHGGKGAGRISSIRLGIFRNSSLGTTTSANWNVTYRPWLTTLAPIFTNFSRSVVSDQLSASSDTADYSFGSKVPVHQGCHPSPKLRVQPTKPRKSGSSLANVGSRG